MDMTKNPLVNALAASVYIILVVSIMYYASHVTRGPDTIIVPIVILSLFTLSAATMGYVFLFNPVMMYIDGKKKQAVSLFLQTLTIFAALTAAAVILLISKVKI